MAIVIESATAFTATGDQVVSVPTGKTNVCIVVLHVINDADGAHTVRDGVSTFGAINMTDLLGAQIKNGAYCIDAWYLNAFTGTGNQTYHYGNHGGFGTIGGVIYVLSGVDPTTPLDVASVTNATGSTANPSLSLTTATLNALLLSVVGDANALTAATGQTVDNNSDSNIAEGSRVAGAAGSQTETWTATAGTFAMGLAAIRPASGVAPAAPIYVPQLLTLGVG